MSTRAERRNETQIVADPALPTIVITREFDAPPERVFRAYTDPELVIQWLGPRRLTMRIDEYDARNGGSYRYVHSGEDGAEYAFHGVFHEVRPSDRIVQTFTFEGVPDSISLETVMFEDLDGRTRVTTQSLVDSIETRDAVVASGMEHGVRESYERLDTLLSDGKMEAAMNGTPASGSAKRDSFLDKNLGPYVFTLFCFIGAAALVFIAKLIFDGSDPDTFRRKFAELALQLALIVVLGALFKFLVDGYANHRTKLEQDQEKRIELLRRLRAQHVRVSYARRLIMAHGSGLTYTQQVRELMLVIPELEDIAEDVKAAKSLFRPDDTTIVGGIEKLVEYLTGGADEYVRCHGFVDADAIASKPLEVTIREHNMLWVDQFITTVPDFPERYHVALTLSKGSMRKHVYGS